MRSPYEQDDEGYIEGLDMHYGKLYGKFKAVVKDVDDPLKMGRVRLFVEDVMAGPESDPEQWLDWAEANVQPAPDDAGLGGVDVPPLGAYLWVTFEQGDVDYPIFEGGRFVEPEDATPRGISDLAKGEGDAGLSRSAQTVNNVVVPGDTAGSSEYPFNRVIVTKSGQVVEYDNSPGVERIRVRNADGTFIELAASKDFVVQALRDVAMHAARDFLIACGQLCAIGAANIMLGDRSATEPIMLGDRWATLFKLHTHSTGVGPSGQPLNILDVDNPATNPRSVAHKVDR